MESFRIKGFLDKWKNDSKERHWPVELGTQAGEEMWTEGTDGGFVAYSIALRVIRERSQSGKTVVVIDN